VKLARFLAVIAVLFASAVPARAELAFFHSGQSLSIKEHHLDGAMLVLTLRNGGQIICEPSTIARFAPDEVPYPEPEPAPPPTPIEAASTAVPYGDIIDRVSAEQGVDAKLIRALIKVESAYQPRARSHKGAMGLMQLMPATAREYAAKDPYDPESNIQAGVRYLKTLLERLPRHLALAAYNAGEAAVARYHGIPPYPETRAYVSRILDLVGR
jgi:soluble lytic murein transglycosylase-like protein